MVTEIRHVQVKFPAFEANAMWHMITQETDIWRFMKLNK